MRSHSQAFPGPRLPLPPLASVTPSGEMDVADETIRTLVWGERDDTQRTEEARLAGSGHTLNPLALCPLLWPFSLKPWSRGPFLNTCPCRAAPAFLCQVLQPESKLTFHFCFLFSRTVLTSMPNHSVSVLLPRTEKEAVA